MNFKIGLFLFVIMLFLFSCSGIRNAGFHRKIRPSYEVKVSEVPVALIEAFQNKYPANVAEKWYKISDYKYAVSFNKDGVYKFAYFSNVGIFQDEEIDEELYYDPYDEYEWEEIPEEYF